MNAPQGRAGDGSSPGRSERIALAVTVTGVLILSASTVVQVVWLVALAVGGLSAMARARRPEHESPSSSDGS